MIYLSLDTANALTTIAIITSEGEVLHSLAGSGPMMQAREAALLTQKALRDSNIALSKLSGIVVTSGPGSFTGCRLGLALVKGIILGSNLPVMAVTTLELVAAHAANKELGRNDILVMLDASRKQVYSAYFNRRVEALSPPQLLEYSNAAKLVDTHPNAWLVGSGVGALGLTTNLDAIPDALMAADFLKIRGFTPSNSSALLPLYLRPAV